ncbi:unnamed protein product [Malus baccata var. baccata]
MPELVEHLRKSRLLLCIFLAFLLNTLATSDIPLGSKISVADKTYGSLQMPGYSSGIRLIWKSFPLDQQLLVWSDAADLIIGNNFYAQLTSKTRQLSVVSAALNDNENLVLLNQEKHIVWQTASKNCVSSYYTLLLSASSQLQLRWESHVTYWTSGSLSSSNLSAFITSEGALQLRDQNLKPVWSLSGQDHNDSINYRFLRLDVDGNLRLYSWVEDQSGRLLRTSVMSLQPVANVVNPSLSSVSYAKICADPLAVNPNHSLSSPPPLNPSHKFCFPCLIGAAAGMFVVFILKKNRKKAAFSLTSPNSNGLIVLSFSEIEELTKNFKYQIGPKMFKGLQGYCCEVDYKFLVYEYVKNGSLEKYIEDLKLCKKLTWGKRFDICSSVSRAVCYLHTSCREFVSHGNLKCENVVLDENLEAKVTEFGLGNIVSEVSCSSCSSAERDVEDFGKMVLVLWAYKEWLQGHPENVVDRKIIGGFIPQELERALRIAFWCVQIDERRRPPMREVVKVLEGTLSVDPPPPSFSCQGPRDDEEEP